MKKVFCAAAPVIFVALAAGCGAGSGGEPVVVAQVDTIAGVERLLYPGSGGPTQRPAIDTIALIGGADEDDDAYQFNQVTGLGLAGDSRGNLYVLDQMGRRVIKYDAQGRYQGRFGRGGNGPGELGSPIAVAIGPGDSVWVADLMNGRFVIYPQDGGESRSLSIGTGGPVMPGAGFTFRPGGALQDFRQIQLPNMRGPGEAGRALPPLSEPPRAVVRMSTDGEISDTLWTKELPPPEVTQTGGGDGRIRMIRTQRTFEPALHWAAFSDDGIAVADSAEYVIHLLDADGNIRRRIDRDLPARQVTEADKEAARDKLRERMQSGGGVQISISGGGTTVARAGAVADGMAQAQLEAMTFAPVVPRITGIRVDQADRIWVGVSLDNVEETDRIDIYDRNGSLITQLMGQPLPTTFFGADLAARVVRDEFDVEQIVIYRSPLQLEGAREL